MIGQGAAGRSTPAMIRENIRTRDAPQAEKEGRSQAPGASPRARSRRASRRPPRRRCRDAIREDGGSPLGTYRDPLGGHWQILAALPIDKVEPDAVPARPLRGARQAPDRVIDALGRFLDPIIAVRSPGRALLDAERQSPAAALRSLGARSIVALVLPEPEIAYKILALNTEKAHNLREKSLEVIRMARDLAPSDSRAEKDYALEFEEPAFLTLGVCYEKNGRFAGGAYHPLLKRIDEFLAAARRRRWRSRAERGAALSSSTRRSSPR